MFRVVIFSILFQIIGCVSPSNWSSQRHFEAMSMCRVMCSEAGVKQYNPLVGQCECAKAGE